MDCTNGLTFNGVGGALGAFTAAMIPGTAKTPQALTDFLNNVWLPSLNLPFQAQAKVLTFTPLTVTAYTADFGTVIPLNWWLDP